MNIIIKVESEEHKQKILEVLENAEMDGQLDFSFSVQTKRGEWMNKEKQYNKVIQDTSKFLNKKKWLNFDVFCIVYGVLYSVFEMVYFLAPNKKQARKAIFDALKNYETENE